MRGIKLTFILIITLVFGCAEEEKLPIIKSDLYFNSVSADSSGLSFKNELIQNDDINIIEYLYYYNGGGVALGDINNDGLEDVYFTANQTSDKLFLNLGDLKFEEITTKAGIQIDSTWSSGVTMADINNDGFLDIYVSKVGNYKSLKSKNQLYINNGDNSFIESGEDYGLDFSGFSTQASFFDYDRDGDLDVYLMNHSVHTPRSYGKSELRYLKDSLAGDRLYENKINENQKKFVDVTEEAGIYSSALGYGLALTTADINGDGFIDIYVGNDFHENDYVYINQGDKTFKESNADYLGHTPRFTMGVDIADINNDQKMDIYALDMMPFDHEIFLKSGGEDSDKVSLIKENFGFRSQYARNTLQLNSDNQFFNDVALMTDTYATDWSWSTLIQDFDNDGLNDIYVTNGIYKRPNDLNYINFLSNVNFAEYNQSKQNEMERKLIKEMPTVNLSNVLFHNKGNLKFNRLTESAGFEPTYSNGAAYADLDKDGDLDILVNNINQDASLLENISTNDNNYVSLNFRGKDGKAPSLGSKITVYADGQVWMKEKGVVRGFQSSSTHKVHFGLGEISKIDSIQIKWPDGTSQIENAVNINTELIIEKKSHQVELTSIHSENDSEEFNYFPYVHIENDYFDFDNETLIPEKLSIEGPAFASADFNGDGLLDLFIGSAKYQSSFMYFLKEDGTYQKDTKSDFVKDIVYEDVDVAVFDIENDGDLDLYVMSGGSDRVENDPYLEDRIYLNDGKGFFSRLPQTLARLNSGSVSAGDFNGDGHMDLFIGNRSIPGGYGLSPFSFILKSMGTGNYTIVKQDRIGMITDSEWVDINNDNLLDLVVTGDWMPITIYINNGDETFTNKTAEYGLQNTHGLWNDIEFADLDNNGVLDIVAGNVGLNSKWQASYDSPIMMYLDDFDENTQSDPIIFYEFFGNNVPFASKDKLVEQLPKLKKTFLDYEKFAQIKTIEDLLGKSEEEILEIKRITELRSMLFMNVGPTTKQIPLPVKAQQSTIEDVLVEGNKIYFVGNYSGFSTELGHSLSNSGGVLTYRETGKWSYNDLSLPPRIEGRKITRINESELLVLTNNGRSYKIKI